MLNDASKKFSNKPETARPTFQRAYGVDLDEEEQEKQVSWIIRQEQPLIDQIVHGTLAGQYWLITGQSLNSMYKRSQIVYYHAYLYWKSPTTPYFRTQRNRQILIDRRRYGKKFG